ncbi:MAG: family permease, partial [Verrucomicrobiales bacterium]|nr:family permease [Verrucomicrobiales bacterium]
SDTVIMILGLLIMTAALMRTGVMDLVGRYALRFTGTNPNVLLLTIMIASSVVGAFMSNTASTAFFIPVVLGIAARAKISPSKLLLPLAFSSILSSCVTLISTSSNIVISGLMTRYKMEPMGMFELAPVGIPITVIGLLYMYFIGRKLLPNRTEAAADQTLVLGMRPYLTEILILPESKLVGRTLGEAGLGRDLDLTVIRIIRDKTRHLEPEPNTLLQPGDILLVEAVRENILNIKDTAGIEIKADVKLSDPLLQEHQLNLVEAIVLPKSRLVGQTLKGYRFRERYGLQVLGINRHGENLQRKMSLERLKPGDVLLLQGGVENIVALDEDRVVRVLNPIDGKRPHRKKAPIAVGIFLTAIVLASFKVVPPHLAVIIGSIGVFVTKCISPEEAYREVEWKAIILIGSMLSLGVAMEHTGAAKYLAGLLVNWSGSADPIWLLSGFFVMTVALTQPMSNQAAAIVVLPVAIQSAVQLNLNPRTFAMVIAVAASCSYLTPLEPSCLMVYGPGRYRFVDFLKVGSLLTLLIGIIALFLVPRFWPLR